MARTAGSVNKTTIMKRQIQRQSQPKPRKKREVQPKGIVTINENYRILLDLSNYILQRRLEVGEVQKAVNEEIDDDEEIEVIMPNGDRWTLGGYFSCTTNGLSHLLDVCVHDSTTRKLQKKKLKLEEYLAEFKQEYAEMRRILTKEMKL